MEMLCLTSTKVKKVDLGTRNRPGILISGHDLRDLEELLEQTAGLGIDVYAQSEALPEHYYPVLRKYPHFRGNYGNSSWHPRERFESFNGVLLFTNDSIIPPLKRATYADRIYTTGSAGVPGATHIPAPKNGQSKDFSELIAHATRCLPPKKVD